MIRSIAGFFFRFRSYTPIPLLVLLVLLSRTSAPDLLVGVGVASLGETIRIWALRHAGPKTRTHRKIRVDNLVVTGPYSVVRNPLYIGNFFLSVGVCVAAGMTILVPLLMMVFAVQYTFIIRAEEEFLEGRLGDEYRRYLEQVPRLVPSFRSYRGGDHRFSFREIIPRELNTITATETVLAVLGLRVLFPELPKLLPAILGS